MRRIIQNEGDRATFIRLVQAQDLPFTASVAPGKKRSDEQNRTSQMWYLECSQQDPNQQPPDYWRGFFKAWCGVPILLDEDAEFAAQYDLIVRPLSYEQKIECMMPPFDLPVTRRMTVKQKAKYLDAVWIKAHEIGFTLTEPKRG